MQKYCNLSKRLLTMLLTVAILLPMLSSALMFGVSATDSDDSVYAEKTDGKIVAENYDLTNEEKELLKSGYLIGSTHDYVVPNASDDLISVDIETKTITVKSFKEQDGYIWDPVSVDVIVNNSVAETIKGFTGNKVSYQTDADAFAVKVKYEMKREISEETQKLLLNASDILKSGVDNLEALLDPNGTIQNALANFVMLSTTTGKIPVDSYNPNASSKGILQLLLDDGYKVYVPAFNTTATIQFGDTVNTNEGIKYSEKAVATELLAQLNANGGKLDIQVLADEYAVASSKTKFLAENAQRVLDEAVKIRELLYALTNDDGTLLGTLSLSGIFAPSENVKTALEAYVSSITVLAGDCSYKGGALVVNTTGSLEAYCSADAWKILASNPIKNGLSDTDYLAIDILAMNLGSDIKGASVTVVNPLLVHTTEIQYNMSMYDVNVSVELNVTEDVLNSDKSEVYDTKKVTLTLAQNATKVEIQAAIDNSGVEQDALSAWAGVYVAEQFDRTVTALPSTLTGDIEYKITYTPKSYKVAFNYDEEKQLPYGYQLVLPLNVDATQAYDYEVNGTYYAQGSIITVSGPIEIIRSVGKSYTSYTVNEIVAMNFFANGGRASDILKSGALNTVLGNTVVNVRVPENSDVNLSLKGSTLTAKKYASSYNGFDWIPYKYNVINGSDVTSYDFNGNETVTITEAEYDRVEVSYRLTLTNITGIQEIIDLPAVLANEAASQIKALSDLDKYYDKMGEIAKKKTIILSLNTFIDADTEIDDETKAKLMGAVTGLVNECFDGNTLKIHALMTEYRKGGLAYYYKNSEKFHKEIETLDKYLVIIGDEKDALKRIVSGVMAEAVDYIDEIDTLRVAVSDLKNNLKKPNDAINIDSSNLEKLTAALESTEAIPSATAATLYLERTFTRVPDGKVSINVQIQGEDAASVTFNKGHKLTADDINAIIAAVEKKIADLNYSTKYYNFDYDKDALTDLIGKEASETLNFAFTYTLKTFTVTIEGAGDVTVDFKNRVITLPKSNSLAYRYDYVIFGKTLSTDEYDNYKFTDKEFDEIVNDGGYTVKRVLVDVQEEKYIDLVNDLNKAVASDLIVFALAENNGAYSIIMKIDASNPTGLMGAVKGLAMELSNHGYVAFDENAFIYTTDKGIQISLKALLDTVLNSGFSSDTIIGMMDSNGKINNMKMPGKVISDKAVTAAGAKIAQTELNIGTSKTELTHQLPMYITVGSVPSALVQVRNLLANQLAPYFSFECANGEVALDITLPQKAYEAYLAVLLATENVDITNVNAINEEIAFGFIENVIRPLLESDASVKSIQNTLAKFGYNIDLTGYEDAFETVRKIINKTEFTYNEQESTYGTSFEIAIGSYLEKLDLGALGNMIAEKDGSLFIPVNASLSNLDKKYEALYFDIGASGITNKFGLVEDIANKLGSISGTAVVILLSDVEGDLVFNTTTVLNLNGFTVNGNIVGKGRVNVIDSVFANAESGCVTGSVSGNVFVTGGKYNANVSAFIPEGYEQNADGVVSNKFVSFEKDENGNVTVKLNAGILSTKEIPDIKSLAIDLVAEIILNGFTTNKLYFNGEKVYELTVEDIVGLYTAANRKDALLQKVKAMVDFDSLVDIVNTILADFTDFDAIKAALDEDLANGTETAVFSYALTTGTWGVSFNYIEKDDSISLDITSENTKESKLDIVLSGSTAEKERVASLVGILADTTDVRLVLDAAAGRNGNTLVLDVDLDAEVKVDISKDPKYALLLNVIIADGIGASSNEELVAGLEDYFKTGDMIELEKAFNKLTFNQIVKAVKNFQRTTTFESMLANIGLNGYSSADAAALEEELDAFIHLLGALLRKADINGPAIVMGSIFDAETKAYTMDKENIERSFSQGLFSGYSVTLNVELAEVFASVKIFDNEIPVIDYSELEAEIAKAEALNKDDYTEDSWAKLEAALEAAKALLNNATSQVEVDAACNALKNAYEELELKPVVPAIDYSELEAEIAKAEALNKDDYTEDSWAKLEAALEAAKALLNNATSQVEVDAACNALKNAREELELKPVVPAIDYSELKELLAVIDAMELDERQYTPDTWANFYEVYTLATALIGKANYQQEVDAAYRALLSTYNALKLIEIDYSALEAEIAKAEALNEEDYTEDSWATLKSALETAKALLNKAMYQDEVDAACDALKAAREALKNKPVEPTIDYSELEAEIAKAEALVKDEYTEDSWATLESALQAAKALLNNATSQTEVNDAVATLKAAREALQLAIDYTELKNEISKIEGENLKKDDYTEDSWAAFQTALTTAKNLIDNAATQAEVDAALAALKAAREALTKLPGAPEVDYSALEAEIAKAEALKGGDYTPESWKAMQDALSAAKAALTSKDQTEVNNATEALANAIKALKAKQDLTWIWIVAASAVVAGGGIAAAIVLVRAKKKKKLTDSTPLVDYNIDDDNA